MSTKPAHPDTVPLDEVPPPRHVLVVLTPGGLGGMVWACQCRATGSARTSDDALDGYLRHNPTPRNPHRLIDRSPANIGRA